MIGANLSDVAWRRVDDGTLVVHRTSAAIWHLNAAATAAWPALTAPSGSAKAGDLFDAIAAALRAASHEGQPAARIRRVVDLGEVIAPIELARGGFVRHVGAGVLWCAPDGRVSMFTDDAAALWDRLALGSAAFATLCDLIGDRFGVDDGEAERRAAAALEDLRRAGAIDGLESLSRFRSPATPAQLAAVAASPVFGVLGTMQPSEKPRGIFTGVSPVLTGSAAAHSPAHVAIVCQYGIAGLAPGVDGYVQSCVRRLEQLNPDLVILTGGGRHGLSTAREAESVIDRYRAQLPGRAIWIDRHSETTWENLQHSLEMLEVASIIPRRISFVGDRARTEKLRLCCWLAKQRFTQFRRVMFRVVPLRRARFTWRDRRGAQLIAGCMQALRDYRAAPPSFRPHA